MDRRNALQLMLGAAVCAGAQGLVGRGIALAQAPAGPFSLPPLGYPYEALEPHIDTMTMNIHHTRHHQAYVNAANGLVAKWPELGAKPIDAILKDMTAVPVDARTAVSNNIGGHWNHTFFWDLMTPGGAKEPAGELKAAIDGAFGDVGKLKERVNAAGTQRFGSGWAWLIVTKDGKLDVVSTANQDPPLALGAKGVVLGVDVWEHAYYLKYQNKRADYLAAWWNTVNWDKVAANFKKAA